MNSLTQIVTEIINDYYSEDKYYLFYSEDGISKMCCLKGNNYDIVLSANNTCTLILMKKDNNYIANIDYSVKDTKEYITESLTNMLRNNDPSKQDIRNSVIEDILA